MQETDLLIFWRQWLDPLRFIIIFFKLRPSKNRSNRWHLFLKYIYFTQRFSWLSCLILLDKLHTYILIHKELIILHPSCKWFRVKTDVISCENQCTLKECLDDITYPLHNFMLFLSKKIVLLFPFLQVFEGSIFTVGQVYGVGSMTSCILIWIGFFVYSPIQSICLFFGGATGTLMGESNAWCIQIINMFTCLTLGKPASSTSYHLEVCSMA